MAGYIAVFCILLSTIIVLANVIFPHCYHPVRCFNLTRELTGTIMSHVDPCDNIYDYVCGRWTELYPNYKHQFQVLQERLMVALLKNMDRPLDPNSAVDKMGIALMACMNVQIRNLESKSGISKMLEKYDLTWPTTEERTMEQILRLLVALTLNDNLGVLFQLKFSPYLRTDDRFILEMTLAPTMYRYILNAKVLSSCILSFSPDVPGLGHLAEKIVEVEQDAHTISEVESPYDELPRYYKFRDLNKVGKPMFTFDLWVSIINEHLPERAAVGADTEFLMRDAHAFKLTNIIFKYYEFKSTNLLNYIMWKIIKHLSYASSFQMSKCHYSGTRFHWSAAFSNNLKRCLSYVKPTSPYALLKLQLSDVLTDDTMELAINVTNQIRAAVKGSFNSLTWLDKKSAEGATERLNAIYQIIGIPAKLRKRTAMDAYYAYIPKVDPDNFVQWLIDAHRALAEHRKRLLLPSTDSATRVSRDDWEPPDILVNAFYIAVYHMIFIPGTILMPPFLTPGAHDAFNYGSTGKIIGHELTHAFDPQWITINNTGEKFVWYTSEAKSKFLTKRDCIIVQANELSMSQVLGNNSFSEAFADTVGLESAYLSYRRMAAGHETYAPIAGLTAHQAFFVSSCFSFCAMKPDSISEQSAYLPHELRCNQPIINVKEFADAFHCPKGKPMNPNHRCTVH